VTIENTNNTLTLYPVEQPFKYPLLISILFVLLPALALYWFLGDSSSVPRAFKLFFGNWISPIILWFFAASFYHLLLKKQRLKKEQQQTSLLKNNILPAMLPEIDNQPSNDEALFQEITTMAQQQGIAPNNLLLSRLALFLNHHEDDIDDTFGIKEREQMKGSYALPRFMIWAIPILGFIGTVWGISNGIAHFSDAMTSTNSVTDVSAMLKENLPLVTNSLATAFDTTLLALLLSIPLMMFMLNLEKEEEAYLIDLDESWFHDIKPALMSHAKKISGPVIGTNGIVPTEATNTQVVADEIKLLSAQIKALQETMEDLYETVFTSGIGDKK